jgi:hypothetical protein
MSTSNGTQNGKHETTEVQQLIDFLRIHMKTDTAIGKAIGYHSSHVKNIYDGGKEAAKREGFTLMFRQLASDVMIKAARNGTLVTRELPLRAVQTKADIEAVVRRIMSENQAA